MEMGLAEYGDGIDGVWRWDWRRPEMGYGLGGGNTNTERLELDKNSSPDVRD